MFTDNCDAGGALIRDTGHLTLLLSPGGYCACPYTESAIIIGEITQTERRQAEQEEEQSRTLATEMRRRLLTPAYSPSLRSETLSGAVAEVFRDRAHRRRTRLSVEDARPSETPQMRGLTASQ